MIDQIHSPPSLRQARVEWWNASDVFVRCVNCEEVHHHAFDGQYQPRFSRSSHCAIPGQENYCINYEIVFLFDEASASASYEIDKRVARFVSGGANPTGYYQARENNLLVPAVHDFRDRKRWTEATEKIHISEAESGLPGGYTIDKITEMVSAVVQGRVEDVRRYLESSNDADILLHGVEALGLFRLSDSVTNSDSGTDSYNPLDDELMQTTGRTALHLAACESSPDMVRLLLQKGADPNATDIDGRVPLMEAALWGRVKNVEVLLKYGANKQVDCVRQGQRIQAVDFAKPLQKNSEERYQRSGGKSQVYKENTFEKDWDRKKIACLLGDGLEEFPRNQHALNSFAFTRLPNDENLLTLISNFNTPNE